MILWLQEITSRDHALVGSKTLRLAEAARAGFPVPNGFCLTTRAYGEFVRLNQLESSMNALSSLPLAEAQESARQLQEVMGRSTLSAGTIEALRSAYNELVGSKAGQPRVAVRSSATAEDLAEASFAGQQATLLNVTGEALLKAVIECWASLWSPRAVAYRAQRGFVSVPTIAVLVQTMVNPRAAGVAFSIDPVHGDPVVVIEAAFGLGETVVGGRPGIDRYAYDPQTGEETQPAIITTKSRKSILDPQGAVQQVDLPPDIQQARVLSPEQVKQVAQTVSALARHFECPQDVEWALEEGALHVLQTRPITSPGGDVFTDRLPGDDDLWTSGFLNERFPRPVSPLGWSLIRQLLDELAFRDPLRYLGYDGVEQLQVTKLYRGHPYVNVFVFQMLYKVFPDLLLPEDAYRYFPNGRTELRHQAPYPRSIADPRFLLSMARHLLWRPALWWPWHHLRAWSKFTLRHQLANKQLTEEYESLCREGGPSERIWEAITQAQRLNGELLALHRWSLTLADLLYSLLRRLLSRWVQTPQARSLAAQLVTGLPNKTLEMDLSLRRMAAMEDGPQRAAALQVFLAEYGHRSFCLDIYHPTFAHDPSQALDLVRQISQQDGKLPASQEVSPARAFKEVEGALGSGPLAALRRVLLRQMVHLSRQYMPLREEQRFFWQMTLALQRRLFLLMGQRLRDAGALAREEQVFFLTKTEIEAFVAQQRYAHYATLAEARELAFQRLQRDYDTAPAQAYPAFLSGNQPLRQPAGAGEVRLTGQAVSSGLARGRVVLCFSPAEFHKISAGDVLVTRSVDPAWTPVFCLLSALVLESGGQLSHGAVVAREYGLPTVTGIPGIAQILKDGDTVLVDGLNGVVVKECTGTA